MRPHLIRKTISILLFTALLLGLAACNTALPSASPTAASPTVPVTLAPTATSTSTPTPTPQPPFVLLLTPPEADQALASALQPVLEELAGQANLSFETQSTLAQSDLKESLRLVVALPPFSGLADLAAAAPSTQFLALGFPDLQPAGNISVVSAQGGGPDQQGFLAGYLAAVITPDARVGVLSPADTAAGQAARQGFINGVIYYCGLCRPSAPPFIQYPVYAELPGGASQADQQAVADTLISQAAKTVYVFPGAGDESLLEYLAQAEINIIGGITPPAAVQNQWVASIQTGWPAAVQEIWPKLLAGETGASLELPLTIGSQNETLFSPGRQRLVEEMRANLAAGLIDTGAKP